MNLIMLSRHSLPEVQLSTPFLSTKVDTGVNDMADGSQPIGPKKLERSAGLTMEQFNDVSLGISKALALSDVLCQVANMAGADSVLEGSLDTTLCMLTEILSDTYGIIAGRVDAGQAVAS
jgi:hypothetical protein